MCSHCVCDEWRLKRMHKQDLEIESSDFSLILSSSSYLMSFFPSTLLKERRVIKSGICPKLIILNYIWTNNSVSSFRLLYLWALLCVSYGSYCLSVYISDYLCPSAGETFRWLKGDWIKLVSLDNTSSNWFYCLFNCVVPERSYWGRECVVFSLSRAASDAVLLFSCSLWSPVSRSHSISV